MQSDATGSRNRKKRIAVSVCAVIVLGLLLCFVGLFRWYSQKAAPLRCAQALKAEEVELVFTYRQPTGKYAEYTGQNEIAHILDLLQETDLMGVGFAEPGGVSYEDTIVLMCADGTVISLALDLHHDGLSRMYCGSFFSPAVLANNLYSWLYSPDRATELRQVDSLPWELTGRCEITGGFLE